MIFFEQLFYYIDETELNIVTSLLHIYEIALAEERICNYKVFAYKNGQKWGKIREL